MGNLSEKAYIAGRTSTMHLRSGYETLLRAVYRVEEKEGENSQCHM
jgi:hypothetical protein